MKHVMNIFACDNCKKEIKILQDKNFKFPYNEGWIYVFNLELKTAMNETLQIRDKHLCCDECYLDFNKKFLIK